MTKTTSSKVKQYRDTQTTDAIASSLAKKARSFSTVNTNRICSNRESGENKCSNDMPYSESRVGIIQLLYYKGG